MTEVQSARKLSQTKISAYFSGRVSTVLSEIKQVAKKRKMSTRRKLIFPNSSVQSVINENSESSYSSQILFANIPKRKLPAPIFSDDEDSDSENSSQTSTSSTRKQGNPSPAKLSRVLVTLNKPSPVKCGKISIRTSTPPPNSESNPSTFSKSVISSSESIHETTTPSCSKKVSPNTRNQTNSSRHSKTVTVLENVVLSPLKSQQKNVSHLQDNLNKSNAKKDEKKLSYEHLKVLREFFVNVSKNSYLNGLLADEDRSLLQRFFNIDKNYQYLCVKLFLYKPMWYNIYQYIEKIGLKMEDNEVADMYQYLQENGFVCIDYMKEDTFTLLNLLTLKNLREIARSFKFSQIAGPKDTMISRLLKHARSQITLTSSLNAEEILRQRIKEKMGLCVKLSADLNKCLYYVFLLNTFTNPSLVEPQDYFTNVNYFNIVFPSYKVENFHVFYTPREFSRYADAVRMRCEFDKAMENNDTAKMFLIAKCAFDQLKEVTDESGYMYDSTREPYLERFTSNAQYIGILSKAGKHITKLHFNDVKVWFEYLIGQKYCNHKRGDWFSHLALIYTVHLKQYGKAAELLLKAFEEEKENINEVQLHELAHRAKMLNKKTYNLSQLLHDQIALLVPPSCDRAWPHDVVNCKSVSSEEPGRRRAYEHRDANGDIIYLNVEQTALKYYQSLGYPNGEHCEGSLIIASFCLLFWDIIYDKFVKGTFISTVQDAPLDMYTKYFFNNREILITKRLKSLEKNWKDEQLKKRIVDNYNNHSHENSLCAIDSVVKDPQQLYNIITCIGREVLSKIFHRLAENFKVYRSGFPDLIVWNLTEKKAKFVEVKSVNDVLSIKQKLWLNYLMDIGASVAVCHVESKGSRKKLMK